jgi:deoxyhypusine synthase
MADLVPQLAADAVLVKSEAMPDDCGETVKGYDFNNGVNYHELLKSYGRSGFQATNFGKAVEEINKMVSYWSDVTSIYSAVFLASPYYNYL